MSASFTPGPWTFYDDSNDGKTNRIEIVALGKTVARIYHSVPEEDLPNAHLLASAPEMYQALDLMLAWLEGDRSVAEEAVSKARAALAKADGGQA